MVQDESTHPSFEDPLSNYDPPTYDDRIAEALAETTVSSMRLIPYAEISPTASIEAAIRALSGLKISSLLVVENDRLVGIITERDILERTCEQFERIRTRPVADYMTSDPLVIYEDDPAGAALAAIAASGYRHVPVLNREQQIVGVTSPRRVFRFLDGLMEAPA